MTQKEPKNTDFQPENTTNGAEMPQNPGVKDAESLLQRLADAENKLSKLEVEHLQMRQQAQQWQAVIAAIVARQQPPIMAVSGNELRMAADIQIITLNDTGDALVKVLKK